MHSESGWHCSFLYSQYMPRKLVKGRCHDAVGCLGSSLDVSLTHFLPRDCNTWPEPLRPCHLHGRAPWSCWFAWAWPILGCCGLQGSEPVSRSLCYSTLGDSGGAPAWACPTYCRHLGNPTHGQSQSPCLSLCLSQKYLFACFNLL